VKNCSETEIFSNERIYKNDLNDLLSHIKKVVVDNFFFNSAWSNQFGYYEKSSFHFLFDFFKQEIENEKNQNKKTLLLLIFEMIKKADFESCGSGFLSLVLLCNLFENENKQEFLKLQNQIISLSKPFSLIELELLINEICGNTSSNLKETLLKTFEVSGIDGIIQVESHNSLSEKNFYSIEKMPSGCRFKLNIPEFFLSGKTKLWKKNEVKILLVDGRLEKVSELDNLLSLCNQQKRSMVIVSAGFSEEIIGTLKVNFDSGKLDVIPMTINPNLDGLNVLNDIAAASNGDVVNSLKGEMLVFKKFDQIQEVDFVSVSNDGWLVISDKKAKESIRLKINELTEKRSKSTEVQDLTNLYNKRIQSLISNLIIIKFPSNLSKQQLLSEKVKTDLVLRSLKNFTRYGFLKQSEFLTLFGINTAEKNKIVSTFSAVVSVKNVLSLIDQLKSVGGMVLVSEET
jgi:hypothetical protein